MWSMYIAGEFGGMIGTMARLSEITKDPDHLKAAEFFNNEKLFFPMACGIDSLEDMHANQHIPQIIGQMELYRLKGKKRDFDIGRNFWNIVSSGHAYCIGGVGETELFHRAGQQSLRLTEKAAESCASYNMCRLTGELFPYSRDAALMDYYENTLFNHIMASASHEADGGSCYFMPLGCGCSKEFDVSENTCCHGSGMESRFRYLGNIFFEDKEALWICLLTDCQLSGENALTLVIGEKELVIRALSDHDRPLKVRIPAWAREAEAGRALSIERSGRPLLAEVEDGWFNSETPLKKGEQLIIHLPMTVRVREDSFDPAYSQVTYGPWILAALSGEKGHLEVPEEQNIIRTGKDSFAERGGEGIRMIPLARVNREAYQVYMKSRK